MADNDFSSLPLEEKITHKVWKARLEAYEELTKLYKTTDQEAEFDKYSEHFKKLVTDSNVAAQEAGLTAVTAYVENAPTPTKTRESVVPGIVEKCFGSTRAGTKAKAVELLLLYIEIDAPDPVVESVMAGLDSKVPKIVAATVFALKEIVRLYGAKVVNVKPILKILAKIFGHADKNVRAEGTQLVIELYKWLGPALNPALQDLKPVQIKELNEAFEKLPAEKPVAERLLRSHQAIQASANESTIESDNAVDGSSMPSEDNEIDPYDLADPVDALKKLSPSFFTDLASTKWKERKEALEGLLTIVKAPKLADDNYSELIAALAKRIGDANVMVGTVAANCIEAIALGLRKNFGPHKGTVVPPVLEKLKEKKQTVVDALRACLDAVFSSVELSDLVEEVTAASGHKNPQVKAETHRWLTRNLKTIKVAPGKGEVKWISELFLKGLDDGDTNVRDAAAEGLGTLMKAVGEKVLSPFIEKLDKIKEAKVREYFEKAEVKVVQAVPKKPTPAAKKPAPLPRKPAPAPASTASEAIKSIDNGGLDEDLLTSAPVAPKAKPPARLAARLAKKPASAEEPAASAAPKAPPKPAPKPAATSKAGPVKVVVSKLKPDEPIRFKYSNDDFEAHVPDVIPDAILKELLSSNWKSRLAAMESLHAHLEENLESTEPELIVRQLVKKPGFKEVNFQVSTKMYGIFQLLCEKALSFTKGCAVLTVAGMAEKLGDIKLKKPAGECFCAYGEKYSLQFVLHHSYESWKKAKSPKVLADSLIWVKETLLEFGIAGLDVRELIEFLKTALGSSNAAVRNNSVSVLGCLHMYVGPDIRSFVQELSSTQLSTIDAEFAKVAGQTPPEPVKGLALLETVAAAPSSKGGATKSVDLLDDLFPRVDISSQMNSKLLKLLEDGNWKVRKEGLDEIQKILEAANKRIKPTVGDLPGALKGRLGDSNKNLVILTLEILSTMAVAMGQPFEKPCRIVLPSVLGCLSDNKAHVRAAAINALEKFNESCTLTPMIPAIGTILVPDSPVLRKDLLNWLSDKLTALESEGVELSDLSSLVRPIFQCLQDRSADVRKHAQSVLTILIKNVGYSSVRDQCSTALKGSSLQTVLAIIDGMKPAGAASSKPAGGPGKISPTDKKAEFKRPSSVASNSSDSKRSVSGPSDIKKGPTSVSSIIEKKRATVIPPPSPNRNSKGDEPPVSAPNLKPRAILNKRKSMMPPPTQLKAPSPSMDSEPPILTSDARAKSTRADKDRNQNKWVFDAVRQDLVDLLTDQMRPHFNPDIHKLLFSMEHNRDRDMLSGLTALDDCIANRHYAQDRFGLDFEDLKERYIANSDTLLKYTTLRFYDTNTSLSLKTLDFLEHLISLLDEDGYHLSEYEASAFLPQLINKLGEPKEALRNQLRSILKQIYHLYSPNKVVMFILEHGLKSKNARTRAECLDELSNLIKGNGINVIPIKSFPVIASHIGDRDAQVRNNALSAIVQAYLQIGDTIYKYTGKLSDKEKTMLDEKLKRSKPPTAFASGLPKPQDRPSTPQSKLPIPRAGTSLGHSESQFEKSPARLQRPMSTLPKPSPALPRPSSSLAKPSLFPRPSSALSNSSSLSISPSSSPKPHRPMSFLPRPGGLGKEEMTPERRTPDLPQTPAFHEYQSPQAVSRAPLFENAFTPTTAQLGPVQPKVDRHRVDMFASKITTADASEIVLLMKSIGDILNDDYTLLLPNLNNIVSAMTLKIHILFEEPELNSQPWCRQIKHMLLVFTKMFMKKDVAYDLRVDVLENTIQQVLKLLLLEDLQKVEQTSNSPSMDKTLNTLLTKIIDHTDQNVLYQALFDLYERTLNDFLDRPKDLDTPITQSDEYKLFDVVQKCIWKSSRSLKVHIEQRTIDLNRLFLMIHEFLTRVNPTEWRKKAHAKGLTTQDNPMKTAKAVLFHAAGALQTDVLNFVTLIPSPESSLVVVYLRSYLDKAKSSSSASGSPNIEANGVSSSPSMPPTFAASGALKPRADILSEDESHSRAAESQNCPDGDEWDENNAKGTNLNQEMTATDQMNRRLDRIFELIYDRKHTKQGVSELHELLQAQPEAHEEFEKRLGKASKYFQSFIRRSLSNLSGEFQSPDMRSPVSSNIQPQSPRSSSRISYRESVASFEELLGQQTRTEPDNSQHVRIQEIQRMFGFRRGSLESHSETDSPSAEEKLTSSRTQLTNPFVGDL
ncbi:ARM repeat-containing protein [Basidiobolus meristosporus CBS 931.73]|uniref:ARM repeat-containing protein n=1 Tax=Basidiobolus meristosporus CBS 931.73 TaxID=1314790 RepID=A0A1Y1Z6N9_9FUNG|nr:ARM repeat-containing protein [Basidiobolus meristosporus CBS 931.73]|eukprot:ORY05948.1 ARM repeat-containing protein [Basidiobolus meristosporus CBS 931.73]